MDSGSDLEAASGFSRRANGDGSTRSFGLLDPTTSGEVRRMEHLQILSFSDSGNVRK
jgi:hypothetical protein